MVREGHREKGRTGQKEIKSQRELGWGSNEGKSLHLLQQKAAGQKAMQAIEPVGPM